MENKPYIITANQKYFDSIRGLVNELVQAHSENPNDVVAIERELNKIISDETNPYTPLPFGEDKPSDMVTIYDRIPTVNEDVLINE